MQRSTPGHPRVLPLAALVLIPGCIAFAPHRETPATVQPEAAAPSANQPAATSLPPDAPDAPTLPVDPANPGADSRTLIIHPLTRIGTDAAGKPAILLHLELRDKFDQEVKALGSIRAELDPPPRGSLPGRSWKVDLTSPAQNALMYDDLVTRTYTIPLGGIPDWLIEWSDGRGTAGDAPNLRVWFTITPDKGQAERTLRTTRRLSR